MPLGWHTAPDTAFPKKTGNPLRIAVSLVAAGHVVGVMLGYRPAPSLSPIEEVRPPDFGTDPGNGDSSALRFTFPDSDQRAGSLQPRPREVRDVAGQ